LERGWRKGVIRGGAVSKKTKVSKGEMPGKIGQGRG